MSHTASPNEPAGRATPATPRAPYVRPTLEPLGSWSALTMVLTGGGFIDLSHIKHIGTEQTGADRLGDDQIH